MPLVSPLANTFLSASSHCRRRRRCQVRNKKMIKRRFFKLDHGDRDASDPSSSSSDSELEAEAEATEEESSEDDSTVEAKPNGDEAGSTSSGYASEDSSANDVDVDSTGVIFCEDDAGAINERDMLFNKELLSKPDTEKSNVIAEKETLQDMPAYVLKHKSVFKCKICPRITCLSEGTLRDHLQSKRHARSVKLLSEGRLKAMLNSDGEIENQEIEIPSKDTEDNAENNHEGQKQHKKRFRKKKSGIAKTKKFLSTEGPVKRRQKK
ncbi:hypothetical protein VIGAN_04011100 [Vigna angularis var. angularis]|uniref:C2H2-type domain-containing protein n=1 Tax=Vigna angularis var. angularis TaxID=157739 RepID=A0A0S3RR51_PHAAN|nr:uncharacterized protein LOC108321712 isoform X2 [Vigna angularis]BAT83016.1 hypothetical protein VIGAN_04011100 [Vigna angularis var. angularis]